MCESWEMECLRTPRGAGAKGVNGERGGGGDFRVYKGMRLSCCDAPVSSIMWLFVGLSDNLDPSVRRETRELTTFNLCQLKCLKRDYVEYLGALTSFSVTYALCVKPLVLSLPVEAGSLHL